MNAEQFYKLVVRMRDAQCRYFKYRSTSALNESKQLEKAVDDEIKRVNAILQQQEQARQQTLDFDAPPPPPLDG